MKRVLALFLVFVMVFPVFPVSAGAAETVTKTEKINVMEEVIDGVFTMKEKTVTTTVAAPISEEEMRLSRGTVDAVTTSGSTYYFTTFEDLQELAEGTYSTASYARYRGEGDLMISKSLTMPANLELYANNARVVVDTGVTFRTSEFLSAGKLVVNGTAHVEYFQAGDELTVNGTLYMNSWARMTDGGNAVVKGIDNIIFTYSNSHIQFWTRVANMTELNAVIARAKKENHVRYDYMPVLQDDFVFDKSVTTPENCDITTWGSDSVTINSGCTLTLDGAFYNYSPLTVKGNLVFNSYLQCYADDDGTMTFKSGSTLDGSGWIYLYGDVKDPADMILGLGMEEFDTQYYSTGTPCWVLRYVGDLTRLAKPTGLTWGTLYNNWTWDASGKQYVQKNLTMPGAISWKFEDPTLGFARVNIYEEDTGMLLSWQSGWGEAAEKCGVAYFNVSDPDSGNYYFTVVSEGDYEKYHNSQPAKSSTFSYTKPSQKVGTARNPVWDGMNLHFTAPSSTSYVGGYQVQIFYSKTKSGNTQQIYNGWSYLGADPEPYANWLRLNEWMLEEYGTGYYSYRVRALSSDITKRCNGSWSELSPAAYREPFGLSISNVASTGKIKLTWNAVDGAASYSLFRRAGSSGDYKHYDDTTKTSYTNSSTNAGTTYYYFVNAFDANGNFLRQSIAVSARCDLPRPEVTTSIVASSGKPKLSWKAIEGAEQYYVYRATSKSGTYKYQAATTKLNYTDKSAVAGKTYYYKVKAVHAYSSANSAYSLVRSRTCDLARPVITTSNVASSGKIKISWDAIDGAEKYYIYRATSKDGEYKYLTATTKTSITNTSAEAGKAYYYKVKAVHSNTNANSAQSAASGRTCDLARPVVSIALSSSGKPKLTWDAVDGAVKYYIYRSTSKDGEFTYQYATPNTSYTNTKAEAGVTYYYKVKAVHSNTNANSVLSSVKSIKSK